MTHFLDDRKTIGTSSEQDPELDFIKTFFPKPSPVKLPPNKLTSALHSPISQDAHIDSKGQGRPWSSNEDDLLRSAANHYACKNWKAISKLVPGRTHSQCSQRWRRIQPYKIRQTWSKEEDKKLIDLVNHYGQNWSLISSIIDGRTGKQVRERWLNKLNPAIDKSRFTKAEDQEIISLFRKNGAKWKEISKELLGRTENMVKNRFYSSIKKNLLVSQPELYKELFEGSIKECDEVTNHKKTDIDQLMNNVNKNSSNFINPLRTEKKNEENSPLIQKKKLINEIKIEEKIKKVEDKRKNVEENKEKERNEPVDRIKFLAKKKEVLEGLLIKVMGQIQDHHFAKRPEDF